MRKLLSHIERWKEDINSATGHIASSHTLGVFLSEVIYIL